MDRIETAKRAWFGDLAATLPRLEVYGMAIVLVDVQAGAVVESTAAARALLDLPSGVRLSDLVDAGTIARPDLVRLTDHVRAWRHLDQFETDGGDSTHSWSDQLRIHRRDRSPLDLGLEVMIYRRPTIDAEAAVVTLRAQDHGDPVVDESSKDLADLWAIYDADLRMIAADPALADVGVEPRSQLGAMAWLYAHPDDVPATQPIAAAVLAGHLRSATYPLRLRAQGGRWLATEIEVRRMEGADGPLLVVIARYVNNRRKLIPPDRLSGRELAVVEALFDGLRVNQIAQRNGVAVKTVRNQLAAIFRKLEVAGQVDLLATYHRPARPDPPPQPAPTATDPAPQGA